MRRFSPFRHVSEKFLTQLCALQEFFVIEHKWDNILMGSTSELCVICITFFYNFWEHLPVEWECMTLFEFMALFKKIKWNFEKTKWEYVTWRKHFCIFIAYIFTIQAVKDSRYKFSAIIFSNMHELFLLEIILWT